MVNLVAALPTILALNGAFDTLLGTGALDNFMATTGGFKDFSSPHKDILISTFTTSCLLHGLVRIFASRNINTDAFKHLAIISYITEIIQAIRLFQAGALGLADAAPLILGPLGAVQLLLVHKSKPF